MEHGIDQTFLRTDRAGWLKGRRGLRLRPPDPPKFGVLRVSGEEI